MKPDSETDVLIVGAGPTGLALAAAFTARGRAAPPCPRSANALRCLAKSRATTPIYPSSRSARWHSR